MKLLAAFVLVTGMTSQSVFAGANDSQISCSRRLFVGGPVVASITVKDESVSFMFSCPAGNGKFPEFRAVDELLRKLELIAADEFVESMKVSGINASECSQPSNFRTLISCYRSPPVPLQLVIATLKGSGKRPVDLQSESVSFSTARRVYEQTKNDTIVQGTSFDASLRLRLMLPRNKSIHFFNTENFDGPEGCKERL